MSENYCFGDVLGRNEYNTIEMYSRGLNTILNRCV
jgi:hypothetical protein